MVCIKQVSIPAVVLLSIAEQAAAAPLARRYDIAARNVNEAVESIDLATREPGVGSVLKTGFNAVKNAIKKNPGKTFDRTLTTANTGMTIANTHKTVSGKRDVEDVEERDFEDLYERDLEWDALDLATREPGVGSVLKTGFNAVKNAIKKNPGKTFDRTLSTANTGMTIANTHKTVSGKRDVEELDERDFDVEELELALRDLEERGLLAKVLTPVIKATKAVTNNVGKTFDRTLATANTGMTIANTHKTVSGKRDVEELEEREWDELEERDFEEFDVRDLEDLDERDVEEIELALRDLEERALLAKVLTPVIKATKAVKNAVKTVVSNKGKTFDRTLATANTGMTIANTHKTVSGKRDLGDIEDRDLEYINNMSERDLEDLELVLRSIYGEELGLETRTTSESTETVKAAVIPEPHVKKTGSKGVKAAVVPGPKVKKTGSEGVKAGNKAGKTTKKNNNNKSKAKSSIANAKNTQQKKASHKKPTAEKKTSHKKSEHKDEEN